MKAKNIPEEQDGRTINSLTGQRNRGQTIRMSIDMTHDEQKEFTIEAVEHNMTLRGYFYHCWRNSQRYEGLHTKTLGESGVDSASLVESTLKKHRAKADA